MARRPSKWIVTVAFLAVCVLHGLAVGFVAIGFPTNQVLVALAGGGLAFSRMQQPLTNLLDDVWLDLPGRSRPAGIIRLTVHGGAPIEWCPRYGVHPVMQVVYSHSAFMPLWPFSAVLGTATVMFWRRDRRPPPGHCESCGYDLRGSVSGFCSECGHPC